MLFELQILDIYIHSILFSENMEIVWVPIHNVNLYKFYLSHVAEICDILLVDAVCWRFGRNPQTLAKSQASQLCYWYTLEGACTVVPSFKMS